MGGHNPNSTSAQSFGSLAVMPKQGIKDKLVFCLFNLCFFYLGFVGLDKLGLTNYYNLFLTDSR